MFRQRALQAACDMKGLFCLAWRLKDLPRQGHREAIVTFLNFLFLPAKIFYIMNHMCKVLTDEYAMEFYYLIKRKKIDIFPFYFYTQT